MIRSLLYLQPRDCDAKAVAEMYRSSGVLDDAAALEGCLGAELQVPLDGRGPLLVTALWQDSEAYQEWVDSPARADHGEELAKLVEPNPGPGLHGRLYEIVVEATA